MGLYERQVSRGIRLWAPAYLNQAGPMGVSYLPVFPVELYFDLFSAMLIGTHPIPASVLEGYRGYLEEFIKDSYKMKPIIQAAGVDAPNGEHVINLAAPKDKPDITPTVVEKPEAPKSEEST